MLPDPIIAISLVKRQIGRISRSGAKENQTARTDAAKIVPKVPVRIGAPDPKLDILRCSWYSL